MKRSFVIIRDFGDFLVFRKRLQLPKKILKKIDSLETDFIQKLIAYIPFGYKKVILKSKNIRKSLKKLYPKSIPLVALDPIYVTRPDFLLQVSANYTKHKILLKNRIDTKPLLKQVNLIKSPQVCLVDCGHKSGWTIQNVINLLKTYGIRVPIVLLGIRNVAINEKLFSPTKIKHLYSFNLYEWIELHDLLLFQNQLPNDRVSKNQVEKLINRFRLINNPRLVKDVIEINLDIKRLISKSLYF